MSIAVSAIVYPSRFLIVMVGAMAITVLAIGGFIGAGLVGELSVMPRLGIAAFSVFLAFFGFYHGAGNRKPIHIDISGVGLLRLTETNVDRPCADTNWPHVRSSGEVVRLLKDSTIWPCLLLLRLQLDGGRITTLPILPDCVSRDSFRALSVACRWIAARNSPSEREI